jgi:hypothetical protein
LIAGVAAAKPLVDGGVTAREVGMQTAHRCPRAIACAVILTGLLGPIHAGASDQERTVVIQPDNGVTRALHSRLAAAWWQWAVSIPATDHPLSKEGPVDCGERQPGPVWFLGGVVNRSAEVTRSCTVPFGQPLFLTVINVECSNRETGDFYGATATERRRCAEGFEFSDVTATIDNNPVEGVAGDRVTSPPFTMIVPPDNILGIQGPVVARAAASGVHLLVAFLSPGSHTIHMTGTFPAYGVVLDITYELTVEAPT